jgi:hypothetical protein
VLPDHHPRSVLGLAFKEEIKLTGIELEDLMYGPRWDDDATIEADWLTLNDVMHELSVSEDPDDEALLVKMEWQLPTDTYYVWTDYTVDLTSSETDRVRGIIAQAEERREDPDTSE